MADAYKAQRYAILRNQLISRSVQDPRLLAAFGRVERHCYITVELREQAYADHPLTIGYEQTISQLYIVAYILA